MKFEGKICGVCNKSRLHAFKDEISPGVSVDAYKCEYGHVSYPKEVMQTVEALLRTASEERHVVRVGSSIAVPIPASIVKLLGLRPKEKVFVSAQDNKIIIRPSVG